MVVFAGSWLALCAVIPVVAVEFSAVEPLAPASILQYLVLGYAGTRVSIAFATAEPTWFDSMFWIFSYIWIGLAGYAQLAAGQNPYRIALSTGSYLTAALVALLGMIAYDVGRWLSRRRRTRNRDDPHRVVDTRRTMAFAIATIGVMPFIIDALGGWESLFLTRYDRTSQLTSAGLLSTDSKALGTGLLVVSYCLPLVGLLAVIRVLQDHPGYRRRVLWIAMTVLLAVLLVVAGNPIANPRYWSGTILLGLLLTFRWPMTRFGCRVAMMVIVPALLVVFPYADYFRFSFTPSSPLQPINTLLVTKGDYDTAVQMVNVIDFVNATGGTHGNQVLGILGFFVPRAWWPDKPDATGSVLAEFVGFSQTNVSSPLWTEAYIDGGFIAVAVVFLAAGYWFGRARLRPRGTGPTNWTSLMLPVFAGFTLILLRGSIMSSIGGLLILVGLSLIVTRSTRGPRTSVGGPPT